MDLSGIGDFVSQNMIELLVLFIVVRRYGVPTISAPKRGRVIRQADGGVREDNIDRVQADWVRGAVATGSAKMKRLKLTGDDEFPGFDAGRIRGVWPGPVFTVVLLRDRMKTKVVICPKSLIRGFHTRTMTVNGRGLESKRGVYAITPAKMEVVDGRPETRWHHNPEEYDLWFSQQVLSTSIHSLLGMDLEEGGHAVAVEALSGREWEDMLARIDDYSADDQEREAVAHV